ATAKWNLQRRRLRQREATISWRKSSVKVEQTCIFREEWHLLGIGNERGLLILGGDKLSTAFSQTVELARMTGDGRVLTAGRGERKSPTAGPRGHVSGLI